MIFYLYLFSVFCYLVEAKNEGYRGYKVYNIDIQSKHQQNNISLLKSDLIDFWTTPSYKYGVIGKVMVPPSHFNWFEEKLEELGVARDVYIEDVYEFLKKEERNLSRTSSSDNSVTFNIKRYHRYDDILNYLRTLPEKYTDTTTKVELVEFGVTDQNRPLVYLQVSDTKTAEEKPIVVVEAAINPRDWITIPAALNILEQILEEKRYLEDLEWIVIPVLNPDGYEYTHSNLRLWQKTRSTRTHLGAICPGVNINRNFNIDWLHFDSSSSPCSHLFGGTEPFSDIETQMIQTIIDNNKQRIKLYISLQNNGGYISYPWSYERAASGMFRQHHLLGLEMVKAMNKAYKLDVGSIIFDRASGTSSDFARTNGILYTYNIDVVQSEYGFVIPEEDIHDIVDDVWKAVAVAADEMIRLKF